jgi:glycosyltransferase involved in cell wall biosynthesis
VLRCGTRSGTRTDTIADFAMTITIGHVNVARGYRGGERQTELLIRGLASRSLRQVLVARRGEPLAQRMRDVNIELRLIGGSPFGVARATRHVDLVHVHEGRSIYGAYLRWLLTRTPYVVTRRVNNPIREHWFAHAAYRHAACVAAVASQVAEVVRQYEPRARVQVIHSGSSGLAVDRQRSAAIRAAFGDRLVVGHVGALDNAQKGQEHIIRVARELQETASDVQFVLVGGGDDEAMLKRMAEGLRNLVFTGFVENVGDYLAAFDMFILPSNREGIGSILFDAMEQGLPVIASRVGGVPDIVHHGENGLLIDAARPDQLRAAILELRAAPTRRRELGARGRELAERVTADIMCRKYLDLYEAILGPLG